jgi:hypothetical protein
MIWLLLIAFASADEFPDSDIEAKASIDAPAPAIHSALQDLNNLAQLYPEDCLEDWVFAQRTHGVGAKAMVTYRAGRMKRRLGMTIQEVKVGMNAEGKVSVVDLDHAGDKGFVTRWTVREIEDGSEVTIHTYINAPGWPLRRYYHRSVQPKWTECYDRTLANLPALIGTQGD